MPRKVVKKETKKEREIKERDEWKPIQKMTMPHKIGGSNVLMAKFKPNKIFGFDEVVSFAKKMRTQLMPDGVVQTMQISIELSKGKHYSSKMKNIDEEIDIQDYRDMYDDQGGILGFSILLT
jgi:hypothetical protein